ncbi:hypothetical protein [Streptomyces sp. NRRL S-241]|uniref:hypothetical protein n=1 Tax=Streptomyces sp. NRRL S-241 TaxID=1463896 RepID=UPI000AB5AD0B|nr:hypothetical protein [Streptomyces sp. NRRL S-241]
MRIRMTIAMPEGAARNGEPWPALGEEVDLPAAEAAHLIASGVAEEVAEETPRPRRKGGTAKEATDSAAGPDS